MATKKRDPVYKKIYEIELEKVNRKPLSRAETWARLQEMGVVRGDMPEEGIRWIFDEANLRRTDMAMMSLEGARARSEETIGISSTGENS